MTNETALQCEIIANLLQLAATWDRDKPTYATEMYVQWPEHITKEVALTWVEVLREAAQQLNAVTERKGEPEHHRQAWVALAGACQSVTSGNADDLSRALDRFSDVLMDEVSSQVQRKANAWDYLHGTTKLQMDGGDRDAWTLFHRLEHVYTTCPQNVEIDAARKGGKSPQVPDIDYTALIRAAWSNHKYAQGTVGCIAFKHGAEWFRGVQLDELLKEPKHG